MAILETKHQKKSFIITSILYVLIFIFLFIVGLKYLDPPPESGIAVNFGTTDYGSGDVQPTEAVKSAPKQNIPEPTPQETSTSPSEVVDDVATQETEDAPVIEEKEEPKVEKEQPVEKTPEKEPKEEVKEIPEEKPVEKVPEKEPDPQPNKDVTDAMDSLLNGDEQDGADAEGEGDDNKAGDKGDPDGDPNAKSYYGSGTGIDGDGNYRLGGRKALAKTKYVQDCNETGEVVVEIEVNRNGEVVRARAGVKGTTNNSKCLLEPAERAARNTKFNKDENAPSRQIGYITYVFRLSE
jgi:outer membrane biosynthesis protein TonB